MTMFQIIGNWMVNFTMMTVGYSPFAPAIWAF